MRYALFQSKQGCFSIVAQWYEGIVFTVKTSMESAMLVLTRRENGQIIFPDLGISLELVKLSRSRATIGIIAPKEIRVIRGELLEDQQLAPSKHKQVEAVRHQIVSQIEDEIASATQSLRDAQEELALGNSEQALHTLASAIAELDRLRDKTKGVQGGRSDGETQSSDQMVVAGGVAESATSYATQESGRAWFIDPEAELDCVFLSNLRELRTQFDQTRVALVVLHEQSHPDQLVEA